MSCSDCIRILVVDDERLARERVRDLLEQYEDVEVVGECVNGFEAASFLRRQDVDLMFLDVQMPEADGFTALEATPADRMPYVIFVTAYDQYAVRAFEVNALDYLLKPYDRSRFEKAFQRARHQVLNEKSDTLSRRIVSVLEAVKGKPDHLERIIVKSNGHIFFIKTEDIDWIESEGNYVRLHAGKESHLLRETISALEAQLDVKKFLRVHRSTIVNIDRVKELQSWFHGDYRIIMQSGVELMLSRSYKDRLNDIIGKA